ncbi:MAG: 50S ribosomal protein L11 methyltransferase [Verrucomicrobiota bacterium]
MPVAERTILWRRLVPVASLDPWLERLTWVGLERVVTRELPGRKRACLEVYCQNRSDAGKLMNHYGGEIRTISAKIWLDTQQRAFLLPIAPHCCIISPGADIPKRYQSLPQIELPAAMAFGTGEHPTTAMCLRQLLKRAGRTPIRILDAGCGSGILALAAALKGHQVTGIDFDPVSIKESMRNQKRNPHIPAVEWKLAKVESIPLRSRYSLIVANLFLNILDTAVPRFHQMLPSEGSLILSGILRHQEEDALRLLQQSGFELEQRLRKGKWLCLVALKAR